MENISKQLLIIAITAFIIGTIIGYQIKPQKQTIIETEPANIAFPSEDGIIRVGYIATSQSDMEYIEPIINEIIEPDINHYVNLLGHNFTFEFVLDHADGQAFIHQKKVEKLNDQGIDIFIGGLRSSMAQISLGYVNEKNMLMVSPRSKSPSPLLTLPDDMLFRTCPTEFHQAPILVDMIESMGISHVIVLQRADGWGDGIYELFISEWVENGGVELFRRRYPGEEVEYSKYLVQLDHVIQEAVLDGVSIDRIGVLFLGFDEQSIIAVQSLDYPFTRNVLWFKPFYDKMRLIDEPECVQLRFFYPYHSPYKSKKWDMFASQYLELTGREADYYIGADYDAAWIIALSILQTRSTNATIIANCITDVSRNYFGVTGRVNLDVNGDRIPEYCEVRGQGIQEDEPAMIMYGEYYGASRTMLWYDEVLIEQKIK